MRSRTKQKSKVTTSRRRSAAVSGEPKNLMRRLEHRGVSLDDELRVTVLSSMKKLGKGKSAAIVDRMVTALEALPEATRRLREAIAAERSGTLQAGEGAQEVLKIHLPAESKRWQSWLDNFQKSIGHTIRLVGVGTNEKADLDIRETRPKSTASKAQQEMFVEHVKIMRPEPNQAYVVGDQRIRHEFRVEQFLKHFEAGT